MKALSIMISKMALFAGKKMNRGSVLPGKVALKIDKNIMNKLELPDIRIAVTGSSGKGSTTALIADVLRDNGLTVSHNISGSNLTDGILTSILENTNIKGKVKTDALVIECDERYAKFVFPSLKPNFVVITNITRDQPPRQGNFDLVFKEIKKAITPEMHLILNADDPYLQKFTGENEITYFGLDKDKYDTKDLEYENLNFTYCPKCNTKLKYDFVHFENIGHYKCPNCDFKHPLNTFNITNVDYENNNMTINDKLIKIPFPMLFAIYNSAAAYTTLSLLDLNNDKIVESINKLTKCNTKQFNNFKQNNREVYVLNNKNENSTTFNQSLLFLDRDKTKKTVVVGWKEISRRYKYNDLSWLYDINFEILKKHDIEKIICVGIQKYDIATRMKLAGLDNIECFDSLENACNYLKLETKENIYAILNFDYVDPFTNYMKEENND